MISGIVKYENDAAPSVPVYETNADGVPLRRNNTYIQTLTDVNGTYKIDLPKSANFFITFTFMNDKKTFATNNVPNVVNFKAFTLPEAEKKDTRSYFWTIPGVLLLMYGIYQRFKK